VTHDIRRIAALDGFVAVNSALSVDLFGQRTWSMPKDAP
jgi:hypothetical protein